MHNKYKIAILGIGGVGGYIGANLAAHYDPFNEVEIFFIVRGENEKAISKDGLKLITPERTIISRPAKLSADPAMIGPVDLILCCTKSYNIEDSMRSLMPCMDENTMILPLLNGVDARERIKKILPSSKVLEGCIYIVTRLVEPGVVEKKGNVHQVFFGSAEQEPGKLKRIEAILRDAGIDAKLLSNINGKCWEKFFFISTIATLTTYLDKTIGEIVASEEYKTLLLTLMKEFAAVAEKKLIVLPDDIVAKSFERCYSLPFDATSSMHADSRKGHQTEVNSLTKYIVDLGSQLNVSTPLYDKMLKALMK